MLPSTKQEGFTLIEALLATALLGIGFAGVYSMVSVSAQSMAHTVARQKLQMQADQILDIIESDLSNIDLYVKDLENCVDPNGAPDTHLVRAYEWCSRMNTEVGATNPADERSVDVTTLADGRKVVHVLLEAYDGVVQVAMKRTYDAD